ncbi:plasmid partitioning protein RepB [Flexibacterium corallicola]|uniref:plasmid partitioning protein RepB n=1 Tax=Flexibacterium corallicola TaxID=3037259 RepID=UPI00286ECE66|nr:plasmid partitioning protein RepB [Pseudovibrio sp. M1P-2-3]
MSKRKTHDILGAANIKLGESRVSKSKPKELVSAYSELSAQTPHEVSKNAPLHVSSSRPKSSTIRALNPNDCFPSFISDRIDFNSEKLERLVKSIEASGQEVPILVREHPEFPGKYQIAYGHRRVQACKQLGIAVNGVVKDLDDLQLMKAQGKENNDREGLTFIELALFSYKMRKNKASLKDVADATGNAGSSESLVSKNTAIVESIAAERILQIGSAPGIGRPNWKALAEHFDKGKLPDEKETVWKTLTGESKWELDDSETRFLRIKDALDNVDRKQPEPIPAKKLTHIHIGEKKYADVKESEKQLVITLRKQVSPDITEYVAQNLHRLIEEAKQKNE